MAEYSTGAYFIARKKAKGGRRTVGIIITVLLILTAAICVLAFVLPRDDVGASAQAAFGGKTFYLLATSRTDVRADALSAAQNTSARGGAGYVYNNGKYNVIAAAYKSKSDAQALVDVNDGSFLVELSVPSSNISGGDLKAARYIVGEWFDAMYAAASDLERALITEAQADRAAQVACAKLFSLAGGVKNPALCRAIEKSADYSVPSAVALKSYIRYIAIRAVVALSDVLK